MRRPLLVLLSCLLLPSVGLAAGFGTPVMDGSLVGDETAYGAVEASDPMDAPQGNPPMDVGDLYVCNDNDFWYFLFTVYEDIQTTNWGKYILFIDTTNDAAGGTTDAWGRNITVLDPHKAEYTVRSWLDAQPYELNDSQLWSWDGLAWNVAGTLDEAALGVVGSVSTLEWKIARSALGDPATIWCSIATTSGGATDNAQDTINDPADDWNAVDWVTTAMVANSTEVARSTGTDTTPPTVVDGCALDIGQDPSFSDTVRLTFSEPVDATTALNAANYAVSGGRSVFSVTQPTPTTVEFLVSPVFTFGSCETVTVTNVEDVAGNPIVANGTTNIAEFYGFELTVNGFMSVHMQADDTPPHTFAIEGSLLPLTWDPLCDFPMTDVDADSVYTAVLVFCVPCVGGVPQDVGVDYKFTHQCTEYETSSNHFFGIDLDTDPTGQASVDIWWNDEAPVDFTDKDIDVVFTVENNPPFALTDVLGVNGNRAPLNFDVPPINLLADDGLAPDVTAGDGIYTTRITFPMGTLKDVAYKFLLDTGLARAFEYECFGQPDRALILDDTMYSTTVPLVADLALWDDCINATGVGEFLSAGGVLLEPGRPNPSRETTAISYTVPTSTRVRLDVYDVSGRLVRTLVDEVRPEGRHTVVWNGRLANGAAVPTGVYFTRVTVGTESATEKLVRIR